MLSAKRTHFLCDGIFDVTINAQDSYGCNLRRFRLGSFSENEPILGGKTGECPHRDATRGNSAETGLFDPTDF